MLGAVFGPARAAEASREPGALHLVAEAPQLIGVLGVRGTLVCRSGNAMRVVAIHVLLQREHFPGLRVDFQYEGVVVLVRVAVAQRAAPDRLCRDGVALGDQPDNLDLRIAGLEQALPNWLQEVIDDGPAALG